MEEDKIHSQRLQLCRFLGGVVLGNAKVAHAPNTGKVQFMLREEETIKIVGNFNVEDDACYRHFYLSSGSTRDYGVAGRRLFRWRADGGRAGFDIWVPTIGLEVQRFA